MKLNGLRAILLTLTSFALLSAGPFATLNARAQTGAQPFVVAEQEIDDLKSVFARVESKDRVEARVRTGGTVAELKVDEGAHVEPGEVLAVVVDPKIALRARPKGRRLLSSCSRACRSSARMSRSALKSCPASDPAIV